MSLVDDHIFEEQLMAAIRERFAYVSEDPFSGPRIYFENAGGTLKLSAAAEVCRPFATLPDNAGRETRLS